MSIFARLDFISEHKHYELASAAHDTIEFRDGSVLAGDLVSVNGMQVLIRIGGNAETFDRNHVKRILLTERDPVN
jgi:hypothetical protein